MYNTMATEDIIVQNMWDAGDSIITQLELNKNKRIRIFDNNNPRTYVDADGDTWDYPIKVLNPCTKRSTPYAPLLGMHNFFFIDTVETHSIEKVAGIIPDKGLDKVYEQYTARTKRKLYGVNYMGFIEPIIEFDKNDNLSIEADKPEWL